MDRLHNRPLGLVRFPGSFGYSAEVLAQRHRTRVEILHADARLTQGIDRVRAAVEVIHRSSHRNGEGESVPFRESGTPDAGGGTPSRPSGETENIIDKLKCSWLGRCRPAPKHDPDVDSLIDRIRNVRFSLEGDLADVIADSSPDQRSR
jgi:hypothetical protein